jgi:phytoene dehydrogenase-like protein
MEKRILHFHFGNWKLEKTVSKASAFEVIVYGDSLGALAAARLLAKAKKRVLVVRGDNRQKRSAELWTASNPELLGLFLNQAGLEITPQDRLTPKALFPILENNRPPISALLSTLTLLQEEMRIADQGLRISPYCPQNAKDLVHLPARLPLLFPWLEKPFEQFVQTQLGMPSLADEFLRQLDIHFPHMRKQPTGRAVVLLRALHDGALRYPMQGTASLQDTLMRRLLRDHRVSVVPNHGGYELQEDGGKIRGVRLHGGALWSSDIVISAANHFAKQPWIGASKAALQGHVLIDESEVPDISWLSGVAAAEMILRSE